VKASTSLLGDNDMTVRLQRSNSWDAYQQAGSL